MRGPFLRALLSAGVVLLLFPLVPTQADHAGDTEPPVLQVLSPDPADGALPCLFVMTGRATDTGGAGLMDLIIESDRDGSYQTIRFHGETEAEWTAELRLRRDFAETGFTLSLRDGNGNEATAGVTYTRDPDSCRPSVTIHAPAPHASVPCTYTFEGNATGYDDTPIIWVALHDETGRRLGVDHPPQNVTTNWTIEADLRDLSPGDHTVVATVGDQGGTSNTSLPLTIEKQDVLCWSEVTFLAPTQGDSVTGIVRIEGETEYPVDAEGLRFMWFYIDDTWVGRADGPGRWSIRWNTWDWPNGIHDIRVMTYTDDERIRWHTISVEVANDWSARVETKQEHGTLGCSVAVMSLRTSDLCGDGGTHEHLVAPGLTAARVTLEWEGDIPADLESLSLDVTIGGTSKSARAEPGAHRVVLEMFWDGPTARPATSLVSVRAGSGGPVPGLAHDTPYTLRMEWAYFGAPFSS